MRRCSKGWIYMIRMRIEGVGGVFFFIIKVYIMWY